MSPPAYDCIVVGGGPAGLSAALVLGRARRRVLVCDEGRPRNRHSAEMHGFLTRDGIAPDRFLALARAELGRYPEVELRRVRVEDAEAVESGFEVRIEGGVRCRSRTLLLATGMVDEIPALEGIEPLYGRSVHHCPYCDGWEHRDEPLAAYGRGEKGANFALTLTRWSRDVVWCSDGPAGLEPAGRERLLERGVALREERIVRLEGRDGRLERVVFERGPALERRALFFTTGQRQASPLPAKLGCAFTERGAVATGSAERTPVPGLYVAGDASKDAQLAIVAAAEGAEAAVAIDRALTREDLALPLQQAGAPL